MAPRLFSQKLLWLIFTKTVGRSEDGMNSLYYSFCILLFSVLSLPLKLFLSIICSFSAYHQCHLLVLIFFTSQIWSLQPTMPAFTFLTLIICMVLVFPGLPNCPAQHLHWAVPLLLEFRLIDSTSPYSSLAQRIASSH